jgi:hypothetical protein
MTKLDTRVSIDIQVHLVLNEQEAGALDALAGYGIDSFLEVFYEKMGRHYLQPYEDGLRSLFKAIGGQIPSVLREVQECRQFIAEAKAAKAK